MSSLFTLAADTFEPLAVTGFTTERDSRNIVHPILGSREDAITYRPSGLRSGTWETAWPTLAEAQAFEQTLSIAHICHFNDTDVPQATVTFVVTDRIEVELVSEGLSYVRFGWQEVG